MLRSKVSKVSKTERTRAPISPKQMWISLLKCPPPFWGRLVRVPRRQKPAQIHPLTWSRENSEALIFHSIWSSATTGAYFFGPGGGLFVAPILSELILNRYLSSDVPQLGKGKSSRVSAMWVGLKIGEFPKSVLRLRFPTRKSGQCSEWV